MDVIWTVFLFALGACVGSFLNVVVWRMPRGQSIVFPGSHCPACGRAIRWYDNIPLVSWLALRARCRDCKAPISPRYFFVELAAACLVAGLFVCYYVFRVRRGAGQFADTWPMFLSNAALLCGLLAASLIDVEHWIIPLEVCWVVSLIGAVSAAAAPPPWRFLPHPTPVSGAAGAMALAAGAGLIVSLLLVHYGYLQRSFLDAEDRPREKPEEGDPIEGSRETQPAPVSVAFTKAHGVDPRREVLREVAFLTPALLLAAVAWLLVARGGPAARTWASLRAVGWLAPHMEALLASLFGYLVGGLWIWSVRILGTLGFGKEAMGLGDVHILAAVGAVCGWVVPSLAFFLAAFLALAWAVALAVSRHQRELPYGPWLAGGALVAMVGYDYLMELLRPYTQAFKLLFG